MYNLRDLQEANQCQACINGKWVPARPINHTCRTFIERLREAWGVFTGKFDAVKWPEGQ